MNHYIFLALCPKCGQCHSKHIDGENRKSDQWIVKHVRLGYAVKSVTVAKSNNVEITCDCDNKG